MMPAPDAKPAFTKPVLVLTGLFLLGFAMPIASIAVRWLDRKMPEAEPWYLAFIASLVPTTLVLLVYIIRMNIDAYHEDYGQLIAFVLACASVPLGLLLGTIAASKSLRRLRESSDK